MEEKVKRRPGRPPGSKNKKTSTATNKSRAKQRVDEILEGVPLGKKTELAIDKLDEVKETNNLNWLKDQISDLSKTNEALEKELENSKNNYTKLFTEYSRLKENSNTPMSDGDIQRRVQIIFNDLNDNFLGHNKQRVAYKDAKLKPLLEKFLKHFPFLMKKR